MRLHISEIARDEELGILKKRIKIGDFSIITPTKAAKSVNGGSYAGESNRINEITRKIDMSLLENFHTGEDHSSRFVKGVRGSYINDCLNFPIFSLETPTIPNVELTKTLSHVLYSASDKTVCLPTVKKSSYSKMEKTSGGKDSQKVREDSVKGYIDFQKLVIQELKVSNSKEIIGVIPFGIPPKFTNQIIDEYFKDGISSFIVDGNTSNLFNKEPLLRGMLSRIHSNAKEVGSSLANTYIHGINLGSNNFTAESVPADDFLNLFAYMDTIGTVSKSRFVPKKKGYPAQKSEPKRKVFINEKYSYDLAHTLPDGIKYSKMKDVNGAALVKKYNEHEQYLEAKKLSELIGNVKMKKHLESKKGLNDSSWKCINKIFESIKIT